MTKLDLLNMALDILGEAPISSVSTNSVGQKLNRWYNSAARYVLLAHPWQEAITWATLESEATDSYTAAGSGNAAGATSFVMTATISDDTPQSGTLTATKGGTDYEVDYTSWSTTTFTTEALPVDLTSATVTVTPNFWEDTSGQPWEYMYDLPSDCLQVLDLEGDEDLAYQVEGAYLYTDEYDSTYGVKIRYIKDIRAESNGSLLFTDAVAECVAARLAFQIAPAGRKQELRAVFEDALQDAIYEDGEETRNEAVLSKPFITETS